VKVFTIVIAAVLVAAALLMVFGIPANFLVGALQARVETDTGYRLHIDGEATIGFWPSPTVSLREITLLDGNEVGSQSQFKAESARIVLSFADLLRGNVRITQLTISRPTLRVTLVRERVARVAAPAAAGDGRTKDSLAIDRILIEDGTVGFYNGADRLEDSIDHINLDASLASADGRPSVTGSLYLSSQMLHVDLQSQAWPQHLEGQTIPVEFTLQAPGLLEQPLSASAELRARNSSLAINALSGRIGQSSFNGWATLDFGAGKPLVKGDLDFDHLQILLASDLGESWSDREIKFDGLNFFDADMRVSAAEFELGSFHFAPIAVEATINRGVLQANLVHTGLYRGEADGVISLDASGAIPAHTMHVRLDGMDVLPLLSDVADFESLEGILQANIDVNARGGSQQAVISSLTGTVDVQLSNGAVRGIDLAKLMHDLTTNILNGWQQNASDKTPLSELTARFRLANGIASTDNLQLSGPIVRVTGAGSIDLTAKTLQLKVDPRLVAGPQGSSEATGLGVPVLIQGSWSEPRIYPDVAGILVDPNGAYNQLKAAGKGLFGDTAHTGNNNTFDSLIGGLGNIFNPPAGNRRGSPGNDQ
jgi:AsmA protein